MAALTSERDYRLLIGGELQPGAAGETRTTINPSTGDVLAEVPQATAEDVARAVEAAQVAQPAWEAIGLRGRTEAFHRLADALAEQVDELALLDALDGGNPIRAMQDDVRMSVEQVRLWPALALSQYGRTIPASPGNLHYTAHRPYGVVGRIVPFNHPAMFAITRILPALIAGNSVVLKPAEQTPLSALALGEIARDVLPPGVLNVITGGSGAGDAIVTHPTVKRIAFTGSVRVGMLIQRRAAEVAVKHVSLELGGKNAMIVFPDADVEAAVEGAVFGMNFGVCQGQSCGSTSRLFVHRVLYDEFVERMAARLEAFTVGPAADPASDMGPVVSAEHHARVCDYIDSARAEGGRLVTGGPDRGLFIRPTLVADARTDMRAMREEIFGPVACAAPWDDYETVVRQANESDLGLTASIWTDDVHLAHATAARLEAGYVWINDSSRHYWGTPFGGMKNSGTGREESTEELESYVETQAVHTILRDPESALARLEARVAS